MATDVESRLADVEAGLRDLTATVAKLTVAHQAAKPSEVLDLRFWTLMRDTGQQEDPDNGYPLDLVVPGKFYVTGDKGVAFTARAGGVSSSGSHFCRYELRQMVDAKGTKAAWNSKDRHRLDCVLSIDARNLKKRKRINGMQIHSGKDDVCQIMLHETRGLGFIHNDGKSWVDLEPKYVDGTPFKCSVEVANNRIVVYYNDSKKADVPKTGTTWFWKMGCYLQTDVPKYGEDPNATGTVIIYSYALTGGGN